MPRCLAVPTFQPAYRTLPGIGLCLAVSAAASLLEAGEQVFFGKAWLEALVLAILTGMAVRSLWLPGDRYQAGIAFTARYFLEISVVLLGASVSAANLLAVGPVLIIGIMVLVATSLIMSFGIGRLMGLPPRMALLIACGNSICGNSAIAAVAPVIRADGKDVAAAIAFTAVFGVLTVLGLPCLGLFSGMSGSMFGAFAGLTVYAVPQVVAATAPLGTIAVQTGMIVKLVRVLMLGPVCFGLGLASPLFFSERKNETSENINAGIRKGGIFQFVPWFILGFLALVACRSLGLIPSSLGGPISHIATILTVTSMAALGLGVDARSVANAGLRVTGAVILSLLGLGAISYGMLVWLHFG
ncbi:MAG: YeiH family protein [Gluconobacter cerinus]|uniref:YeiH family protein n=1 Tax=Gluconobacter cerinus TaxID=38307 RepID=UPI0039ECB870